MTDPKTETPPATPEAPKWNGKFKDDAALLQGAIELGKKLEILPADIDPATVKSDEVVGAGRLFKDMAAVSTFYQGLEVRQGKDASAAAPSAAPKTPETPPAAPKPPAAPDSLDALLTPPSEDDADLSTTFTKAGVDVVAVIAEGRELNDAEIAKFKTLGFGKKAAAELLTTFKATAAQQIAVQQATIAQVRKQAADSVGGDDQLKNLMQWAAINLPEAESYRSMVKADPKTLPGIVEIIKSKHAIKTGKAMAPSIASGVAPPASGVGFTDPVEFARAAVKMGELRMKGTPDSALEARIIATEPKYRR